MSSLLFAGTLRVFRDERFALSNTDLEIRTLSPSDTGEYVCQVSTNPPTEITHYLKVLSEYRFSLIMLKNTITKGHDDHLLPEDHSSLCLSPFPYES